MKLKLVTIAFFAAMGIASSATAQDGQINFTGKITETGCKINGGVTSAQDVKLGEVSKTALPAAGDTAATTRFSLVLTECPEDLLGKPISVKYDGTPDNINTDYLQLTGAGSENVAEGVAIQLLNDDTSALPLGTSSRPVTISNNAAEETTLNFFARYIATTDTVKAGDANGTVNFTLTYN